MRRTQKEKEAREKALKWLKSFDEFEIPACKFCGRVMMAGVCCSQRLEAARVKMDPEKTKLRNEVQDLVKKSHKAAKKGAIDDDFPPHVKSKLQKDMEAVAEAGTADLRPDQSFAALVRRVKALEEDKRKMVFVLQSVARMMGVAKHVSNSEYWHLQHDIDELAK